MRNIKRYTALLICLLLSMQLIACNVKPSETSDITEETETTAVTTESRETKASETSSAPQYTDVAIMSTTDMHGKCWDVDILTDGAQDHNMLRVSSAVNEARTEFGKENVILIDNGDLFQGTPESQIQLFQFGSGESKEPPAMALCLKEIGYDAFSLGNHEFNYSWDTMQKTYNWLENNGVPVISCNICYDGTDNKHSAGENVFTPYITKTIKINGNDHKIGILGIENCDVPRWDLPVNYPGLVFVHPDNTDYSLAKEAERYITQMKQEDCEFIIVSYHGGEGSADKALEFGENTDNQGERIVKENKDIGILINGHDHTTDYSNSTIKDASGKDVPIVNGGGQEVTRSVFRFSEDASGKLTWKLISTNNLSLDDYEADNALKQKIAPYAEIAENEVSKPVGKTSGTWDGNSDFVLGSTDTINLVCAAIKDETTLKIKEKYKNPSDAKRGLDHLDVDLVMTTAIVKDGYTVQAGDINYKDIYMMYRFANNVIVLPMTGKEIKAVMEENASERLSVEIVDGNPVFSPINSYYTNIIFGCLNFRYDMAKPAGSRVIIDGFANGRTFRDDDIYLVAVNNYIIGNDNCGLRSYTIEDSIWNQLDDDNSGIVQDLIADYIISRTSTGGSVTPSSFNWHWEITYSGTDAGPTPDPKNILAKYENDPQDGKNYIIYQEKTGISFSNIPSATGGYSGIEIPLSGTYLTGKLPDGAIVFTLFYDENMNFTLRDQKGNFLVSSADGTLMFTDRPVEDRYQFWRMEKVDGGWIIVNVGASGKQAIEYDEGTFKAKTYSNFNTGAFVFNFYETGTMER